MILRLCPLLLLAALAGCAHPPQRSGHAASPAAVAAECRQRGGQWLRMGRAQAEQCLLRTSDAGRPCSDSTQCEGQCLAAQGSSDGLPAGGACSADTNPFGCRQRVSDGVASTICVD